MIHTRSSSAKRRGRSHPARTGPTVIADAGHESRKLAAEIKRHDGWQLLIVKRSEQAFKIVGLNWIIERTLLGSVRYRRPAKDYEYRVQTSETLIQIAAVRLMLGRLAAAP